ncbi:hypothetical protein LZC95_27115 [Pendulispora brunnea]|uniref:Uncharacterized protein n=1 Tax=Pendulispora brunnea TaxID=2905690 RepID=A0ABZ2JUH3_9BACT
MPARIELTLGRLGSPLSDRIESRIYESTQQACSEVRRNVSGFFALVAPDRLVGADAKADETLRAMVIEESARLRWLSEFR